jgi:hypothetical protein
MYKESLDVNKRAMAVDERYFKTSPSDPLYKTAYYPHNIHFVMVSAQMGGDRATALEAAASSTPRFPTRWRRCSRSAAGEGRARTRTHAMFGDAAPSWRCPRPRGPAVGEGHVPLRAGGGHRLAQGRRRGAGRDRGAGTHGAEGDFKPFAEWQVPAKEIVQTGEAGGAGRLADAQGDLERRGQGLRGCDLHRGHAAYMEPPYWYYPVRQSLGAVRLRQGRLDDAEKAFRESLARVRSNGWALAGLAETYG